MKKQMRKVILSALFLLTFVIAAANPAPLSTALAHPLADNPSPPAEPVKLIFVHHSCGENWLADWDGGLGIALRDNNYFVSDTNYGWGPDGIGDNTDIGYWWTWFLGPNRDTYLRALYTEFRPHSEYSRHSDPAPARENEIIMFKSCFPNSYLNGNPNAAPAAGANPLRGQESGSEHHTVANAKGIYNDLLAYFATRQDKLFIAITAPPQVAGDTDAAHAANARAFNNWLVNDWLADYPHNNVAVFDFYNVLTSNGSDPEANDMNQENGNHHRWWNGAVQHTQTVNNNFSAYAYEGDSHPFAAGNQKATAEFVPLLNIYYHRWQPQAGSAAPAPTSAPATTAPTEAAEETATPAVETDLLPTPAPQKLSAGEYALVFQQENSPDAAYAGMTDAILANDAEPNANLGHTENLEIFYGEEEYRRSLLRWDLSALPPDITVTAARVELYRYDGDAASDMPVSLHRVTSEWVEGTGYDLWPAAEYAPDGATWTEAAPGAAWQTPGGDYDLAELDTIILSPNIENGWISLDATTAVRAWIEADAPNYGLLLRAQSEGYYHYFHSSEASAVELRPRLVVEYVVGEATAPPQLGQWLERIIDFWFSILGD